MGGGESFWGTFAPPPPPPCPPPPIKYISSCSLHFLLSTQVRNRSLFIVQGGIEEKLGGGPSIFLKPERGGFEKIQRDEIRGL